MTPLEFLVFGKEKQLPAADLLSQLGFFNDPYQRFLIEIIWYGGYGTADQVLNDLNCAQGINNIWALLEFSSDLPWEKQLGIDNLNSSGLHFIDRYLWWEQGLNLISRGE
jgi:hypothetical protein